MNYEYWKNTETNQVFAFDVSDDSQIVARDVRIQTGSFTKLSEKPTFTLTPEMQAAAAARQVAKDKLAALGLTADDLKALGL